MENQLDMFPDIIPEKETKVSTIIGGIYRDDNDEPDYDGCYCLSMGSNQFYTIFEGINHIKEIVEVGCAHKMKLMEGYNLAIIRKNDKWEWQIRDSTKPKSDPGYILVSGSAGPHFRESLEPFFKVFVK